MGPQIKQDHCLIWAYKSAWLAGESSSNVLFNLRTHFSVFESQTNCTIFYLSKEATRLLLVFFSRPGYDGSWRIICQWKEERILELLVMFLKCLRRFSFFISIIINSIRRKPSSFSFALTKVCDWLVRASQTNIWLVVWC